MWTLGAALTRGAPSAADPNRVLTPARSRSPEAGQFAALRPSGPRTGGLARPRLKRPTTFAG
jgi:hypothetical protein